MTEPSGAVERVDHERPGGPGRSLRRWWLVGAVAGVLLLSASCSDDDTSTSSASDAASTTTPVDVGADTEGNDDPPADGAEDGDPEDGDPETGGPENGGPENGGAGTFPGAEWDIADPAEQGFDPDRLEQARSYAFAEGRNTQGVVVVHDGVIVAEWYAPDADADADSWAASWSVAKSFTSALVGIALEDGLIPSIDEPMTTYFPEWEGTPREAITLRHVLHMESGLDFTEDYDPQALETSDVIQMGLAEPDQLSYAAGRPAGGDPESGFNYSSGDTMLLSGVLEQATGMPVHEYAEIELFEPLGIDQVEWWRDAEDHTLTYCCLDTTSRDFARFGLLYLSEGRWEDEQIVPADWVEASVTDTSATYDGYGYQWWLTPDGLGDVPPFYSAEGFNGQHIFVFDELDLVVVRNGTYDKTDCDPVADPNLFACYPPDGLVPGQGTIGPEDWSDEEFLTPIIQALDPDGG